MSSFALPVPRGAQEVWQRSWPAACRDSVLVQRVLAWTTRVGAAHGRTGEWEEVLLAEGCVVCWVVWVQLMKSNIDGNSEALGRMYVVCPFPRRNN